MNANVQFVERMGLIDVVRHLDVTTDTQLRMLLNI